MKDKDKSVPEILNTITDVVLAYRPKPKSKAAKKRRRLEKVRMNEHGGSKK
jgi:hypothetical protein